MKWAHNDISLIAGNFRRLRIDIPDAKLCNAGGYRFRTSSLLTAHCLELCEARLELSFGAGTV
jgi:hypothetical protein